MRVKCKQRTYVNGSTHSPGDEIDIPDHLYSPEVHDKLSGGPAYGNPAGGPVDWSKQTHADALRAKPANPNAPGAGTYPNTSGNYPNTSGQPNVISHDRAVAAADLPPPVEPWDRR
jgi:hypothetical protein